MRQPKYRVRPDRDSAFVEMDGARISLPGRANSPESLEAYNRLLGDYFQKHAGGVPKSSRPSWDLTVGELAADWLAWAKTYYLPTANTRSNEYGNCKYAVRPVLALYADLRAADFGPDELKAVRDSMVAGKWSRSHANAQVNKIKRMFRWGVEHSRVDPRTSAILDAVAPLRRGRSVARETEPVKLVPIRHIALTLRKLSPIVAAMVRLQRLTGMRPDNLCALRPCDLDRSGDVWVYTPAVHKGSHAEQSLAVPLGPKSQTILAPYLDRRADLPCFSPREAWRAREGKRAPRTRYSTGSYRRAVERGCKAAGVPPWNPHRLRHNAVQSAKRARGLEAARAYVGHARIKTTEIYEARDWATAVEIARLIG